MLPDSYTRPTYLDNFSVVDMTTKYVEDAAELEHRQRRV